MSVTPYSNLAETAFWRQSVAECHAFDLRIGEGPALLSLRDRVATAGSCFAQHIGNQLRARGARYVDLEPLPLGVPAEEATRFGFGLFSCRYGNVYTARQLRQLFEEALGTRAPAERVWMRAGRFYDALRPSVDPVGHDTEDDVLQLRRVHLRKVKELLSSIDVFVFTLGLTETWESRVDGTVYPSAPGVIAGTWDPAKYAFLNLRYADVMADLKEAWAILRSFNSQLRLILTVSPVPLKATASNEHVLVANSQSKSTLRAVAGDLAAEDSKVTYFPSYELVTSHVMRGMFFDHDQRTVNKAGVEYVMSKFFATSAKPLPVPRADEASQSVLAGLPPTNFDLICDEEANDPA